LELASPQHRRLFLSRCKSSANIRVRLQEFQSLNRITLKAALCFIFGFPAKVDARFEHADVSMFRTVIVKIIDSVCTTILYYTFWNNYTRIRENRERSEWAFAIRKAYLWRLATFPTLGQIMARNIVCYMVTITIAATTTVPDVGIFTALLGWNATRSSLGLQDFVAKKKQTENDHAPRNVR